MTVVKLYSTVMVTAVISFWLGLRVSDGMIALFLIIAGLWFLLAPDGKGGDWE